MKHAHTTGPWGATRTTITGITSSDDDDESELAYSCHFWVGQKRAEENAALIALAPTAPHDCDIPGCPGAENKRKLETAGELLAALQQILSSPFPPGKFERVEQWKQWSDAILGGREALAKAQAAKVGGSK